MRAVMVALKLKFAVVKSFQLGSMTHAYDSRVAQPFVD